MRLKVLRTAFICCGVWTVANLGATQSFVNIIQNQQQIKSGRETYMRHCAGCHGADALGNGEAAKMLSPKPRNLVEGSFRFRSTPSGSLPTSEDLLRTLEQGVPGSSMPSFRLLSSSEKLALVAYIKSLRKDWKLLEGVSVPLPPPPSEIFNRKDTLLSSAYRGRKLFVEACVSCHGDLGLGNGESAEGLTNEAGEVIRPANLSAARIKSGRGASAIFKAITTGLDGTPMPGFQDAYTVEQRWDLVAYVLFRRAQGSGIYPENLVLSEKVETQSKAAAEAAPSEGAWE